MKAGEVMFIWEKDIHSEKTYIIKELIFSEIENSDTEVAGQIFEREVELMKKFKHPGLPKLYETFSQDGNEYLLTEYIEGTTLEEIIDYSQGPLPEEKALPCIIKLAETLDYLHKAF